MQVGAFDDFDPPRPKRSDGGCGSRPLISAVCKYALDEREQLAHGLQDQKAAIAVLYVGWVNNQVEHQAERIDNNVTLLAFDFLARVIARRVDFGPPFSAPLTLWLSMMAAVGLASRSACSRTAA